MIAVCYFQHSLSRTKKWVENEILEERRGKTRIFLYFFREGIVFHEVSVEGKMPATVDAVVVTLVFCFSLKAKEKKRYVRVMLWITELVRDAPGNEKPIGNEKERLSKTKYLDNVSAFCVCFSR